MGGGYVSKSDLDNYLLKTGTATNSNALDGVSYSNILTRQNTYSKACPQGWFRVAQTFATNSKSGCVGILILEREFTYNYSEHYIFAIVMGYGRNYTIHQLAGNWYDGDTMSHILTKIRIVNQNSSDGKCYIDMYNSFNGGRQFTVTCLGGLQPVNFTQITDTPTYAYEFTTVKGNKIQTN